MSGKKRTNFLEKNIDKKKTLSIKLLPEIRGNEK